ncbi:MAG: transglutaminase domain-containing protein [Cyclobacteriaceae bacterium]|nr:transglutaminase domain-containing protein [Cyclobacteriaceae bacterium]
MHKPANLLLASFILFIFLAVSCQETKNEEKVQAIVTKTKNKKPSIEDVERGIRANIEANIEEDNGYFNIEKDSFSLSLKLVRVHTEYLSVLGSNKFFACVDLATTSGDVYDVDFFLEGTADDMQVTSTDVHKLNGKPYYSWKQRKDKTWFTVAVKQSSNRLLGVIEGTDHFSFKYEVQLPKFSEPAELWLPIAQSDQFQAIELISMKAPGTQTILKDEKYGNSILHLELLPEHSNQKITVNYNVVRQEKAPYEEENANLVTYLQATELIPVGDRFGILADEIIEIKQANTPLTKARALYDYVIDNVRYAKQGKYGTGDANFACDSKSGNCTEFHSLFISLARSAGIPSRFAVGAGIPSERNEGGVDGYHCWAEFYAEGKWWPVDISEANKYSALATYYFGHHPANRIEFSRGRDIAPDPLPKSGAINFLAYPVFEVGGKPDLVQTKFAFVRAEEKS